MTDEHTDIIVDTHPPESEGPRDASPEASEDLHDASPAAGGDASPGRPKPGSVLGTLDAEWSGLSVPAVLPVGRSDVLACRYIALEDDELEEIANRIQKRARMRSKVGVEDELDPGHEVAALTLAKACEELMWVDTEDGKPIPLVQALAADGVDTAGDAPMVYDQRTAEVLGLGLPDRASSSVDVVIALHTWHLGDGRKNHIPLGQAVNRYQRWLNNERGNALQELLEGH